MSCRNCRNHCLFNLASQSRRPVLNNSLSWSHNLGECAEHKRERLGQLFRGRAASAAGIYRQYDMRMSEVMRRCPCWRRLLKLCSTGISEIDLQHAARWQTHRAVRCQGRVRVLTLRQSLRGMSPGYVGEKISPRQSGWAVFAALPLGCCVSLRMHFYRVPASCSRAKMECEQLSSLVELAKIDQNLECLPVCLWVSMAFASVTTSASSPLDLHFILLF